MNGFLFTQYIITHSALFICGWHDLRFDMGLSLKCRFQGTSSIVWEWSLGFCLYNWLPLVLLMSIKVLKAEEKPFQRTIWGVYVNSGPHPPHPRQGNNPKMWKGCSFEARNTRIPASLSSVGREGWVRNGEAGRQDSYYFLYSNVFLNNGNHWLLSPKVGMISGTKHWYN